MRMKTGVLTVGLISTVMLGAGVSHAAVSADEAAKLKTTLTPLGAERAGNADGSIPAWTGGMVDPNYNKPQGRRDDLFKNDKPLFSITAANMSQYADQLTDGTKAMLQKYPDSYRLDVYKTVRAAAAPQWVYDNTYKNAINGAIVEDKSAGLLPTKVYGGTPFPIPKSGIEVIWNHQLAWRSPSWRAMFNAYLVTADGRKVLTVTCGTCDFQEPYYKPGGTAEAFDASDGTYFHSLIVNAGPPIRAGEGIVGRTKINSDNDQVWIYFTGQRRTRRLPNPCCDAPTPATAGVMTFDDLFLFFGRNNRFNWTLVGKKEMYVPYNDNQIIFGGKDEDAMSDHHLNPDRLRWEKHRVWVLDADLVPGQRNTSPHSRYYIDEDSWVGLLGERYDSNKSLWKVNWQLPFAAPDIPAETAQSFGFYDLLSGAWFLNGVYSNFPLQFPQMPFQPDDYYTPENMAALGVR